jgi:hypothetical protein
LPSTPKTESHEPRTNLLPTPPTAEPTVSSLMVEDEGEPYLDPEGVSLVPYLLSNVCT